ncbi:MAG: Eco57I restriction-modification methylase domain-containing protein [Deltaproteobacteria bacterium]|nr:Eco57I restriction-modification methylase domain-containing protein [Deltaproteobacteria bacterium]
MAHISIYLTGTQGGTTKTIPLNNIYGVDIDRQAVEVTKLSLLLKVLEGENEETIGKTLALFRERALPNLKDNIKCGNSLIGPDFYNQTEFGFNVGAAPRGRPNEGRHMGLPLQDDEIRRINIFDWNDDEKGFGKVMKDGGFDCVIGNPPYVQSRSGLLAEADKAYYMAKFKTTEYQINTYGLFVEQGVNLLKADGILGMIIPNYWLATNYDKKLRDFLFLNNNVIELANVYKVFTNATVDTLLLFVSRPRKTFFPKQFLVKGIDRSLKTIPDRLLAVSKGQWVYQQAYNVESSAHDVRVSFTESLVLRGNTTLGDYFSFKFGMKPYEQGKGNPPQTREMMNRKVYDSKTKRDDTYKPLLGARNVKRYRLGWQKDWIKYGENLAAPRDPEIFNGPRILIQRIVSGKYLDGVYTDKPFICNTDVITLKPLPRLKNTLHIYFFAGILLSRLCSSFLKSQNVNLDREAFPKINANTLERFVVPTINTSNPTDKATHDKIASLVDNMLKLNIKLKKIKTPHEKELLERQIKITDNQIDRLVYELYGLTEEEIKVVEGKEQK